MNDETRLQGGPQAVICDIDDTLLTSGTRPKRAVIDYVNNLDGKLYIVTARLEDTEDETRRALDEAGVRDYDLEMKPDDSVSDAEFKRSAAEEILSEYDVTVAIDNNPAMRRVYASLGIPTKDPATITAGSRDSLPDEDHQDTERFDMEEIHDEAEFRFEAPKDDLVRHVEFRAEPSSDGLTLDGYAAVFNAWTDIDSWEGRFRERIAPGAFKKTLSERMPILQFDHGTHPLIGSLPLGVFTSVKEDQVGLRTKARLSDNWLVEPVRDAIRDGAITGMSFRFRVIKDSWRQGSDKTPERTIQEVALYEAGPVVFPAYEQTSVGVRSREVLTALDDPETRHELARLLLTGTSSEAADQPDTDEPTDGHSTRTRSQRRAIALLVISKETTQ